MISHLLLILVLKFTSGKINIRGNQSTRDEVIRREMRQIEGAVYSAKDIRRSRERIQRLGYFDEVKIETPAVPGTLDQVDINVTVKERSTGSFMFGVGYAGADGRLITGRNQSGKSFRLWPRVEIQRLTNPRLNRYTKWPIRTLILRKKV